jgi:hypothetical protein
MKQIHDEELLAVATRQREEEELAKAIECLKAGLDAVPEDFLVEIKLPTKK